MPIGIRNATDSIVKDIITPSLILNNVKKTDKIERRNVISTAKNLLAAVSVLFICLFGCFTGAKQITVIIEIIEDNTENINIYFCIILFTKIINKYIPTVIDLHFIYVLA